MCLVKDDEELFTCRLEERLQSPVVFLVGFGDRLERRDDHVIVRLDFVYRIMIFRSRYNPNFQRPSRLCDLSDIFLQAFESLLQKMVSVSEPEDFVPVGKGRLAEKTNRGKGLSASGGQYENGPSLGFWIALVPR